MIQKDLNLLPASFIKAKKSRERTKVLVLYSTLILLICFSLILLPIFEMINLQDKREHLQQYEKSTKEALDLDARVNTEFNGMKMRRGFVNVLENADYEGIILQKQIKSFPPGDIRVKTFSTSSDELVIDGIASNDKVIADFVTLVKKTNIYGDVLITSVNSEDAGRTFNIRCTAKNKRGK